MRILVLGGRGMLGRDVVAAGRRRGYAALGLSLEQADIRDRRRLLFWGDRFRPDLIVNCAAFTAVDRCEEEPDRAMEINGRAVANVAAAAEAADAHLIQISTDYVFDGSGTAPYKVSDPTVPLGVYGVSKLRGEEEALSYERACVVRTSWLFGAGGGNFVRSIVSRLDEGEKRLRVVDDQVGCPTYTPWLGAALLELAAHKPTGRLHYCNGGPVSWYGFAREIVKIWSPTTRLEAVTTADVPRLAARPAYSVLDVSDTEAILGRRIEPWSAGLSAYLNHLRTMRN